MKKTEFCYDGLKGCGDTSPSIKRSCVKDCCSCGRIGGLGAYIKQVVLCCIYAVSAYLVSVDEAVKTHNGTKTKFHNIFVKNKLVDRESGVLYDILFSNRQDADYSDFAIFTKEQVFPLIDETKALVELVKTYIKI